MMRFYHYVLLHIYHKNINVIKKPAVNQAGRNSIYRNQQYENRHLAVRNTNKK